MTDTTQSEEPVLVTLEFMGADDAFRAALEQALPDCDAVERSSFSGAEILTFVGPLASAAVTALGAVLLQAKKNEQHRSIKINVGRGKFVELKGYGGDELATMTPELEKLIKAQNS